MRENNNTKRVCSTDNDQIHQSKRIKRSSSVVVARRPSSIWISNTNIGDLPEDVLVEILSRLPDYKYVSQCKCVSKHWCSLLSDPSFIVRFLCLQSDNQTEIIRTLINGEGMEVLNRLSPSGKPLTRLFKSLMSFHQLKEEPILVGTYNDLILCCATLSYQRDYYICNANTNQWVSLPAPPQLSKYAPVGFICDHPYYQCKKDRDNQEQKRQCIQLNAEFRYRVVRLIPNPGNKLRCELKVHIFSSETGEWTESIVATPSAVKCGSINSQINFPYNGVLYWMTHYGDALIGVDPFMITDKSSTSLRSTRSYDTPNDIIDQYRCRFIEFDEHAFPDDCVLMCLLGVNGGCLQMLYYNDDFHVLSVAELNEEEVSTAAGKLCLKKRARHYFLDRNMVPEDGDTDYDVDVLGFDPNDDETVYLRLRIHERGGSTEIFSYNTRTKELLKIVEKSLLSSRGKYFYHLVLPWLPTPVPRLPERGRLVKSPTC